MSEKDLRAKIIRLAHSKPELRSHLLPLLSNNREIKASSAVREIKDARSEIDRTEGILAYLNNIRFHLFENDEGDGIQVALSSSRNEWSRWEPAFKTIENAIRKDDHSTAERIIDKTENRYRKQLRKEEAFLQKLLKENPSRGWSY
tara:strand:+ start:382 stop:819 length:438 start_codon:yes stop_codon:yes gene_type:complete